MHRKFWQDVPRLLAALRHFELPIPWKLAPTRSKHDLGRLDTLGKKYEIRLEVGANRWTLAHEIAHLRHWEHGPKFERFAREIRRHWKRLGL